VRGLYRRFGDERAASKREQRKFGPLHVSFK
jgi:hypothetical protein